MQLTAGQEGQPLRVLPKRPVTGESARCALSMHRYAAAFKPVILLPGVNHGHMSNGHVRSQAGDLTADVSKEEADDAIAGTIITFLAAHGGIDE